MVEEGCASGSSGGATAAAAAAAAVQRRHTEAGDSVAAQDFGRMAEEGGRGGFGESEQLLPKSNENENGSSGAGASASAGSVGGDGGSFECNICLELAQDPVVTLCGHLFCWPCLYLWLRMHTAYKECPVCKAGVEEAKVIPLYGRGNLGAKDPRTKPVPGADIPNRPQGQRPEPTRAHPQHAPGFNFVAGPAGPFATAQIGNFTLSAGFGLFPSLFGLQFQSFPAGEGSMHAGMMGSPMAAPRPGQSLSPEQQQQAFLSRLLLFLGSFVILCLLFF